MQKKTMDKRKKKTRNLNHSNLISTLETSGNADKLYSKFLWKKEGLHI
jgi:hypothetical protein